MPTAQLAVTIAALAAGTICFLLYVYATIAAVRARSEAVRSGALPPRPDPTLQPRTLGIDDASKLADALSKLSDSLSRASPAVTALIGALIFYAIAAVSSGALHS